MTDDRIHARCTNRDENDFDFISIDKKSAEIRFGIKLNYERRVVCQTVSVNIRIYLSFE